MSKRPYDVQEKLYSVQYPVGRLISKLVHYTGWTRNKYARFSSIEVEDGKLLRFEQKMRDKRKQCCGSGMFIPDPDLYPFRIPDPGSKNSNKREG
jgi:hypothetical protein